jgi:AcrR family transcriptional regulator
MIHLSSATSAPRAAGGPARRRSDRRVARSAANRRRESPPSTKARILANAEVVFATKGFSGASTREIAGKAAVNISSLHYHWKSKETLYYAVFQNIFDRIVELVRLAIPAEIDGAQSGRPVIDDAMGALFDFFADHPNVPKLLVRRLLENDESQVDIERNILVPAWKVFAAWTQAYSGRKLKEVDSQLFMLTIHSVLLLFLLDSRHYASLLGGSVHTPAIRRRVRAHIITLVKALLGHDAKGKGIA